MMVSMYFCDISCLSAISFSGTKVCSVGECVCVTSSDYINDGDAWFYDADGMLVAKIATGLNPVKAVVVE